MTQNLITEFIREEPSDTDSDTMSNSETLSQHSDSELSDADTPRELGQRVPV